MNQTEIQFPPNRLLVTRWSFETAEGITHDALSTYVEQFWLGVLGPSTTLLLRHLNAELVGAPSGFVLHYDELAVQLGLTGTGKHSPLMRTLTRLHKFDMARLTEDGRFAVRQEVPSLGRRHLSRLPAPLQDRHHFVLKQLQPV